MRIKLDRTLCDGFGICAVHAPETFSLDEWGYVSLHAGRSEVADEHKDGVRRAILDCPVHAIIELPHKAV
ncbi:Ferredoxin [Rhodococcus ruber BKS 20-38]|uniref:Ferredoxin n=1 Tax=Rhodococcus ruber BKS 20-38 TaxID=1278076 RepID=M2Y2I6_9NOCA|nr:ferredoxin [Rhodococcus ruber]EME67296.1 Ferredoxin [Rhodococcus ruber BKS 20-38]